MNSKQIKDLNKQIKSFIQDRETQVPNKKTRIIWYVLTFPLVFILYIQAFIFYDNFKLVGISRETIVHFLNMVCFLLVVFISMNNYLKLSKEGFDKWLWKKGQRNTVLLLLIFFIQTFVPLFMNTSFGEYKYYAVVSDLAYTIYFTCTLIVVINPKLFLSKTISIIGTISLSIFLSFSPIRIITLTGITLNQITIGIAFLATVFIVGSLNYITSFIGLNIVQVSAIRIINPNRLFISLRSQHQVIEDQYKALKIKHKLDKRMALGVKTELIKFYAEENNNNNPKYWLIGLASTLFVFVLSSLGEAFFQDFLYESYLHPFFCNAFSIVCK